ncbi:VOC family protein [Kangiella sediminilitoris]|uniref:Glyoxalase n=1 Tax=Kangiella sediminilitoris TaxID=1144748 RepID=A0A1B3BC07_9GAMM|nr:VOC family protein [Kangiella sediminilitoris]AOE50331.1 glyoxalase [Kangiella sediminilitoris]
MSSTPISYVEFPAKNLSATKEFFKEVFGWKFTDYGPEYTAFEESGLSGGFYQAPMKSSTKQGSALVVIYSDDLEGIQQTVEASGGSIIKPIFSFPGGRRFHFTEPSGNELAVWSDK